MNIKLQNILVFLGGFGVLFAVLIGYDIFMGMTYGREGTISYTMAWLGQTWPILPFLIGALGGGIFVGLGVHFWGGVGESIITPAQKRFTPPPPCDESKKSKVTGVS